MEAVTALYADGDRELTEAIVASLSRAIFSRAKLKPAGGAKKAVGIICYRVLKWTTRRRKSAGEGYGGGAYHNPIMVRSGHPYARALLDSSCKDAESLVEGGDPMNGPYMMIPPEILRAGTTWDRILLNSVQGRDVQLRFIWETQATYDAVKSRLEAGNAVRLKAIAAGTGLSMIVVYDRLIRDGFDPARMAVRIADREHTNTEKTNRMLAKLATTRGRRPKADGEGGISAVTEDLFEEELGRVRTDTTQYDVMTAIGILEYLQGFTCETTERCLGLQQPQEMATAPLLASHLERMTMDDAALVVNTFRTHASTRILELFGRRFDYRTRENLAALLLAARFQRPRLVGSGNIYDVEVYEKTAGRNGGPGREGTPQKSGVAGQNTNAEIFVR
jgi:hypothetical protein